MVLWSELREIVDSNDQWKAGKESRERFDRLVREYKEKYNVEIYDDEE